MLLFALNPKTQQNTGSSLQLSFITITQPLALWLTIRQKQIIAPRSSVRFPPSGSYQGDVADKVLPTAAAESFNAMERDHT